MGPQKHAVGWLQRRTMNPVRLRIEDALCWTILARSFALDAVALSVG